MKTSESVKNIASAMLLFQKNVGKLVKNAENPFFKSSYATLDNVLDVAHQPLQDTGLVVVQFPTDNYGLTTRIIHAESGEWLEDTFFMEPAKKDPQGAGSVITYQRRYALAAVLGLAQEDDDANAGTHDKEKKTQPSDNKPWLNKGTKEFDGAVKKLVAGTTTITKIRDVMKVSKEVENLLNQAVEAAKK